MAILGAHMSIVGGYYRAVERAHALGCDCVQLFTKNRNQWRNRPVSREEALRFAAALAEHKVAHPIAHASYLINLASPDRSLWRKSTDALVGEVRRADRLGIDYVVIHPGASIDGKATAGLRRVVRALNQVHARTPGVRSQCLLETTAGQGTSLGGDFEHLAAVLEDVESPDRLGICFDTCHVFAAGYPLSPEAEYDATVAKLEQTVGFSRVKAVHLNDSLGALGSRVDRHGHIGRGAMGLEPFRLLLNDSRFSSIPMYLETPKGVECGIDLDRVNLATLRALVVGST